MSEIRPLSAQELASDARGVVGRRVVCLVETGSTNDDVFAALEREGDSAHGIAYFAESQTAGRGRRGRSWFARPSLGLTFTVGLRSTKAPPAPALVSGAAVAVRDAIRARTGLTVRIKWPNDLYVMKRKLCGILVEARTGPHGTNIVVGIGINLNQGAADFDDEVRDIATSVGLASGVRVDRADFARCALDELDRALPAVLAADYLRIENEFMDGLELIGAAVRVAVPQGEVRGRLIAFDCVRGLAVATGAGTEWFAAETIGGVVTE